MFEPYVCVVMLLIYGMFQVHNYLYVAGQIAMVPANLSMVTGGIQAQARLSLQHVQCVLAAMVTGCSFHNVVLCVCYIRQPDYISIASEELKRVTTKVVYQIVKAKQRKFLVT